MSRTHTQRANDWLFVDAIARNAARKGLEFDRTDLTDITNLAVRDAAYQNVNTVRRQLFIENRHPQIEHP